jgi:hypothetical protein
MYTTTPSEETERTSGVRKTLRQRYNYPNRAVSADAVQVSAKETGKEKSVRTVRHGVQTGSGDHPASYTMGTRGLFPRG